MPTRGSEAERMNICQVGTGAPPLVFIPGLQGRWEYARPTVDALARHFRVVTFSLCDEPSARAPFDPARGLDSYGDQVVHALDALGIRRAVICGLSFGGLVALNAVSRFPERASALVLASTPGPGWQMRPRHATYARWPWVFGPIFLAEAPFRARPELQAALPRLSDRSRFAWWLLRTGFAAPVSPSRMASRARFIATFDAAAAAARISAPTLVITGEPRLDHVVPVGGSSQYVNLVKGAEGVVLERTGHQGSLTRPSEFAALVHSFVTRLADAAA